jgi:CCR4-NOT complex subunit CAF16
MVLDRIDLSIERGTRCLLVGANGAGKTTLLRVIGGKHMIDERCVRVLGRPAFHDTSLVADVAFLGGPFPFELDIRVAEILAGASVDDARLEQLIDILGVDREWHMNRVSDGQRRRVQLLLGLASPSQVLLLDEITTDLDLLARADLLRFLAAECEQRGATILYATHILDRLESWATHIGLVEQGRLSLYRRIDELAELQKLRARGLASPLTHLVESWLRR